MTILAAMAWAGGNAEVIAACHDLGFLRDSDTVLDPTYGKGNWWTCWRPAELVTYCRARDGSDFRRLPLEDESVDASAFDPPYVSPGGRKTSTVKPMHEAFGMNEQRVLKAGKPDPMFKSPAALQQLINDGLTEQARVVRPGRTKMGLTGGIILVKCMSYVSGGHYWPGTEFTWMHSMNLGLQTVCYLDLVKRSGGPQPKTNPDGSPRRKQHPLGNSSRLYVFRKPKGWEMPDLGEG